MQTIRLNMTPNGVMPHLYCSRYDVGRQLGLQVYDDNTAYSIPSDAVARVHGIKPDNTVFAYGSSDTDAVVSIDTTTSVITLTTTEQMTAITGTTICELILEEGDTVLGSLNFYIEVEESVLQDDDKTSKSDLATYQQMIDWAKAISAYNEAYTVRAKKVTLLASKWTGTEMPYQYDIGEEYAGYTCIVAPTNDATDDQIESWTKAGIYGTAGSTIIYARTTKPITDIPAVIIYMRLRDYEDETSTSSTSTAGGEN